MCPGRAGDAYLGLGRRTHVGEVHVSLGLTTGQRHGFGVVHAGIATDVIAVLRVGGSIPVFPAVSARAVFPVRITITGVPAIGVVAVFPMEIVVIVFPAGSARVVLPVAGGGPRRLLAVGRLHYSDRVAPGRQVVQAVVAIRIRRDRDDDLPLGVLERDDHVSETHIASRQVATAVAIGVHGAAYA